MKKSSRFLAAVAIASAFLANSSAENFVELWQIGDDNNAQSEFGQEGGGPTAAPGSATSKDDDYYFAGLYPDPIGVVAATEPELDFERAILTVDPRVRVHFNLDAVNVDPAARLRLVVDICCTNHGGDVGVAPNTGPITFAGLFNENDILIETTSGTDNQEETFTSAAFTAADVSAVAGENIITIERPDTGGGNWMQFDYIRLEVDTDSLGCTEPICSFGANRILIQPSESATLNWITDATASLQIDNGIGNVDDQSNNGSGSTAVSPTQNTTYTLTSTRGGDIETASVTIEVANIIDFSSTDVEVSPGDQATLSWTVDPAASVSIDQGVGNIDAFSFDGVGSIDVTPEAPSTTYTLTSTRGSDVATATVTVGANNFANLWQVGEANGNSSELVQEDAGSNGAPGSPLDRDDDWYFAGVYPDSIGIVPADEPLTSGDNTQGFERALLVTDPTNRIHFNLDDANAFPTTNMRLTVATAGSSLEDFQGFIGPIDFTASYNGEEVLSSTVTGNALELHQGTFTAGDVGANTGDNIIEITRKTDAGGAWMLFDYIKLETEPGAQEELRITEVSYDNPTGDVTVTWVSRIGQTYIIEASTDLGVSEGIWGELNDSYEATAELSSQTFTAGSFDLPEGTKRFFVRIREGG
ncbi:MAG: hypothetical protein ACI9MB_003118 [Verrucomicrobiales bacterium]|jgi:hypothetical protein